MNFSEYQSKAYKTAIYPKEMAVIYPTLGLAGEAGEVANQVKKRFRDDGGEVTQERVQDTAHELGDLLWYIAAICTDMGLNMDDIAADNIAMLESRQERGTIHGDGDHR